jgi:hypothetical protein
VSLGSIPSAPADLELIAQLKSKLQYAELRIRVLEERLRLLRTEKYGAGGERARASASPDEEVGQASEPPGVASESSARRADSALPAGSAPLRTLRQRNGGDRLRREFPVGCGAREVFRAGHETREAGLLVV